MFLLDTQIKLFCCSANPGDILRVKIPKLDENILIIPNSVHLVFELEISGHANNVFVNNLNRSLNKV